ncbi:hypothetical protein Zmor_011626 [Zophobas morio]|uniref:CHK kinase-like domain-containing protein n=1 Tax=Zophobas morio TaxID=2755281 RepID=A0AA38IQF0_9CUCU|nr:hypothetical protein Zmor_011626 [Zophobas morio]
MEALKARADLISHIQTVSKENGIQNYVITDVQTNQKGEGYLGQIFLVSIKDAKTEKQLEIVIKAAFTDEQVRAMIPIRMSFLNEIYFYTEVLPSFQKLEEKCRQSTSFQFVPKCLKVSLKDQEEMLILENLKASGFEMLDKKLTLDEDYVRLIFKTYGRYHGYSFVLRDQNSEAFERISQGCCNVYAELLKNDFFNQQMAGVAKLAQDILLPGEDDEIIEKFEKYSGANLADTFKDIVSKEVNAYSVVLHGDCWSNNMMFKYENSLNNKKPTDVRLIDFQVLRAGSPVCDLSYCLYSGASKKIFDNLNDYLKIYYNSFSSFVKSLGSDPEKLFPFEALEDQWKKYAKFGMMVSLSIIRMKLINTEDVVDLTDELEVDQFADALAKQKFDEETYRKRTRELLWHMSEVDAL